MLDIKQIESFYPEPLRPFKKNLLREYMQYKILEAIFDSKLGIKLALMGGTAARIIHGNTRFSEDLDFDNLGLNRSDFEQLISSISKKLRLQGYKLETRTVFKGAFRSLIKIPDVLYENKISKHKDEKLLIRIDMEPQGFAYRLDKIILNKFDVFLRINVVPMDILLSQKIYCIFSRKRQMGRDFYDILFLSGKTKPNLDYLKDKLNITGQEELKKRLLQQCEKINFKMLVKDIEPFLFNPGNSKRILYFYDFIKEYNFGSSPD